MVLSVLSLVTITINTDISFLKTSLYTYQTSSSHTVCSSQLVYTLRKFIHIIEADLTKEFKTFYEKYLHDGLKSQKVAPVVLIYLQLMEVWTHKSSLTPSLVLIECLNTI